MFSRNKYIEEEEEKKRLQTKLSGNHERRQMDKNSTNWLIGALPKQASTYLPSEKQKQNERTSICLLYFPEDNSAPVVILIIMFLCISFTSNQLR